MQWISVGSGIEHAEGGGTPEGEYTAGNSYMRIIYVYHYVVEEVISMSSIFSSDCGGKYLIIFRIRMCL